MVHLAEDEKLRVVASTTLIGDVTRRVGGEHIDMTILIASGQDPHSFQPVPAVLASVEEAHLILVNGFNLEESLLDSLAATATSPIVLVSAGIDPLAGGDEEHEEEGDNHALDPHVWMDPANVIVWTRNIAAALSAADPARADTYQANAEAYIAELDRLDADIRQQITLIPPERRKLVTDHDSFAYFAQAYGFQVVGTLVGSLTTTRDVPAGELAALSDLIRQEEVPGIFVGYSSSQQIVELAHVVAREQGEDFFVLPLYDAGPGGAEAATYLDMMRYNVRIIVEALRGD